RQRPKNKGKQALHYNGKHKAQSEKNVVIVHAKTKRVGYLSQTDAGKRHAKKIVDTDPIRYPAGTILYKDPDFQGYEPQVQQSLQPKQSHAGHVIPGTTAPQSPTVPGPGGACPGGRETLPHREGCLAPYHRRFVRLGNGRSLWLTHSPRPLPQTAAANVRESY